MIVSEALISSSTHSFIHSFIYSVTNYLPSAYYVAGICALDLSIHLLSWGLHAVQLTSMEW